MNIPIRDSREDLDCCVRKYRKAIYNVLLEIKPKYCLEIGTYLYQSSKVFSRYFEENCPEGRLITIDISEWTRSKTPPYRVTPVMVYPYVSDPEKDHGGINVYFKDHNLSPIIPENILKENKSLIKSIMQNYNIEKFDLSFVDGDHRKISFINDLILSKEFTRKDGYILIDDVNDAGHEQCEVYKQLKESNDFYELNGMAIIKNEDLNIDYL